MTELDIGLLGYISLYSFLEGRDLFDYFLFLLMVSRQALQLHKGDSAPVILEIINTIEGGPPVDVSTVRSM